MTSKEALNKMSKYIGELGGGETLEEEDVILKDLKVLEILKNRIHLKEDTLRTDSPVFSNFNEITSEKKNTDIAWVEASGFVFRNSNEYRLLKEWLEEK